MNAVRIAILIDHVAPQGFGGAEVIAWAIAQGFQRLGYDVRVISSVQDPALAGVRLQDGIPVRRIFVPRRFNRWRMYSGRTNRVAVHEVERELHFFRPDAVFVHTVQRYLSFGVLTAARRFTPHVYYHAHDTHAVSSGTLPLLRAHNSPMSALANMFRQVLHYNPVRWPLVRRHLDKVEAVIAVSESLACELRAHNVPRVLVVHNGIDPSWPDAPSSSIESMRMRFGLRDKKVVLVAGRLSREKGTLALGDIAERLQRNGNLRFLIVGHESPDVRRLRNMLARVRNEHMFAFTGRLSGSELRAAYAVADIVFVPSMYPDPFPTVNLEAMACGKPIVGTIFGGTPELVIDGVTGVLVDPTDIRRSAEAIEWLLSDERMREAMGSAGRRRVTSSFSRTRQIASIAALLTVHSDIHRGDGDPVPMT